VEKINMAQDLDLAPKVNILSKCVLPKENDVE
jgi:hypothetical protein